MPSQPNQTCFFAYFPLKWTRAPSGRGGGGGHNTKKALWAFQKIYKNFRAPRQLEGWLHPGQSITITLYAKLFLSNQADLMATRIMV